MIRLTIKGQVNLSTNDSIGTDIFTDDILVESIEILIDSDNGLSDTINQTLGNQYYSHREIRAFDLLSMLLDRISLMGDDQYNKFAMLAEGCDFYSLPDYIKTAYSVLQESHIFSVHCFMIAWKSYYSESRKNSNH